MKKDRRLIALALACLFTIGALGCSAPLPPRVIVLGLDGLSWRFLDPLLEGNHLPNLARVLDGAAFGELETFRPTHSAILWTSVATGKTLEKHGITDWTFVDDEAREEIEQLRLMSGIDRTAKTVWEIVGEQGLSVSVVNWWVTYPARPVNGYLVTDRLKSLMNRTSIADEADLVYPPSLLEELRPMFLRPGQASQVVEAYGFPEYSDAAAEAMLHTSQSSRRLFRSLESYVGQDQMVSDWALHLLRKGQPDLFAVVVRITDVFAHFGWRFGDRAELMRLYPDIQLEHLMHEDEAVRGRAHELVEEVDRLMAEAMLPAYKFADEFVGGILSAMEPDSILMIVSDHGFNWNGGGYNHNPSSRGAYPDKSPPGVIIIKGPDVQPGRIEGARLFDVTPTLLYALGEPVAEDMDGRVLTEVFADAGFYRGYEPEFVTTYGVPQAQDMFPMGGAEQELLEDLRSLGYIGGGTTDPPATEPVENAPTVDDDRR